MHSVRKERGGGRARAIYIHYAERERLNYLVDWCYILSPGVLLNTNLVVRYKAFHTIHVSNFWGGGKSQCSPLCMNP